MSYLGQSAPPIRTLLEDGDVRPANGQISDESPVYEQMTLAPIRVHCQHKADGFWGPLAFDYN